MSFLFKSSCRFYYTGILNINCWSNDVLSMMSTNIPSLNFLATSFFINKNKMLLAFISPSSRLIDDFQACISVLGLYSPYSLSKPTRFSKEYKNPSFEDILASLFSVAPLFHNIGI